MTDRPRWADKDPEYASERERYDSPIPSRTYIHECLCERGRPVTPDRLAAELGIDEPEAAIALRRRLEAMVRSGQLVKNRKDGFFPAEKADLVRGRIVAHPDGFGFLIPDDGSDDLFMHAKQMRSLLHGDRIVAHVRGVDRRGRREGAVVEVLERANEEVVGRYMEEDGIGLVLPDNKRITHDIVVQGGEIRPTPGQIVVARIDKQPSKHMPPMGVVVEVLGEHMAPGMEIDIAIRAHGLPHEWPRSVKQAVSRLSAEVPEEAKQGRADLRKLPFVTIDGADARDFDDAVYAKRTKNGWKLWVAIADVSHYVETGSALDDEAHKRGTSVYFPEQVIPMLPEILSNGLCSLNPEVDRLAMVCEMSMDEAGEVTRARFQEAVIRSHQRLIYDDVAAYLDRDSAQARRLGRLGKHIDTLYELYQVLREAREARGAIDLDTTETRIIYGPDRKIERIVPTERNDAHKLIEECMLAANVTTANWLAKRKLPFLYRVHEGPSADKLEDLRAFLAEFGLSLGGGDDPTPKHYAQVLNAIRERHDKHLIQTVLLRSLSQAVYTPENAGHFGLAYEAYAHFTSPIRRYPDLLVHRAIRHVLRGGGRKDFIYRDQDMLEFGEHASMTERRADDATRDAVAWLKCEFMMDKVGDVFGGTITSVTSFGLFVELDDIYVEGLVHVTSLNNDYYHFDPVGHRLAGERSGRVYRLGDPIKVQVARVDLDQRKVDFEPADKDAGPSRKQERNAGPGKGRKRRKKRR